MLYLEPCGISKRSLMQTIRLCSLPCRIGMLWSIAAWIVGALIEERETSTLERITESDQSLLLTIQTLMCDRFTWAYPCWSTLRPKTPHNAIENEIMSLWASNSPDHYHLLITYMEANLSIGGLDAAPLLNFRALVEGLRADPPMFTTIDTEYDHDKDMRMARLFRTTGLDIPMLTDTTRTFPSVPVCGVVPIRFLRNMRTRDSPPPSESGWVVNNPRDTLEISREFAIMHGLLVDGVWQTDRMTSTREISMALDTVSKRNDQLASRWSADEVVACVRKEFKMYAHMAPHIEAHGLDAKQLLDPDCPSDLCAKLGNSADVFSFLDTIRKRLAT